MTALFVPSYHCIKHFKFVKLRGERLFLGCFFFLWWFLLWRRWLLLLLFLHLLSLIRILLKFFFKALRFLWLALFYHLLLFFRFILLLFLWLSNRGRYWLRLWLYSFPEGLCYNKSSLRSLSLTNMLNLYGLTEGMNDLSLPTV